MLCCDQAWRAKRGEVSMSVDISSQTLQCYSVTVAYCYASATWQVEGINFATYVVLYVHEQHTVLSY